MSGLCDRETGERVAALTPRPSHHQVWWKPPLAHFHFRRPPRLWFPQYSPSDIRAIERSVHRESARFRLVQDAEPTFREGQVSSNDAIFRYMERQRFGQGQVGVYIEMHRFGSAFRIQRIIDVGAAVFKRGKVIFN